MKTQGMCTIDNVVIFRRTYNHKLHYMDLFYNKMHSNLYYSRCFEGLYYVFCFSIVPDFSNYANKNHEYEYR